MSPRLWGPWRFYLDRRKDRTGVSSVGRVADGTQFSDGTVVLRWRTSQPSTVVYASIDACVHVHGHGGDTRLVWLDERPSDAFRRGAMDCYQDDCEGCPRASIGGDRAKPKHPTYVAEADVADYLAGYEAQCEDVYGAP